MNNSNNKYLYENPKVLLDLYSKMTRIRKYEEAIANEIETGDVKTPCHLYIGQEAIAAGVCQALKTSDYVFSYYRGHGHYLAKGGNGGEMLSEVLCKETGCSKGRGGSMHLVAPEISILGNTAIVSGQISLAAGAALRSNILKKDDVSVVFFGDAATEEGVFSEIVNFASLKKLPLILVCENNDFAAHMRLVDRQPIKEMSIKTKAYMPSFTLDGNDVESIYETAKAAVERARRGEGPTFIEGITYRWRGHVGPKFDIDKNIRSKEELDSWMSRCPINHLKTKMLSTGHFKESDFSAIDKKISDEVREALLFARDSNFPSGNSLLNGVYK